MHETSPREYSSAADGVPLTAHLIVTRCRAAVDLRASCLSDVSLVFS